MAQHLPACRADGEEGLLPGVQRAKKVVAGDPANLSHLVAASDPGTIVEHIVWTRDASGAPPLLPPRMCSHQPNSFPSFPAVSPPSLVTPSPVAEL